MKSSSRNPDSRETDDIHNIYAYVLADIKCNCRKNFQQLLLENCVLMIVLWLDLIYAITKYFQKSAQSIWHFSDDAKDKEDFFF